MKYTPDYAKGQVIVLFKPDFNRRFAEDFGKGLGFYLSDEEYKFGNNVFIYNVNEGKEKESIEVLEKYKEFIEWAEQRDLLLESRWESLEHAIDMIKDLSDDAGLNDKDYNDRLKEIADNLKQK
jgi:hypothetical protein